MSPALGHGAPSLGGRGRPVRTRSHAAAKPKMNPPTWAKNATPPPFAWALNSPKSASISWYFRLLTFWLPVPFGWGALRYLERQQAV